MPRANDRDGWSLGLEITSNEKELDRWPSAIEWLRPTGIPPQEHPRVVMFQLREPSQACLARSRNCHQRPFERAMARSKGFQIGSAQAARAPKRERSEPLSFIRQPV